jgi:flagellin
MRITNNLMAINTHRQLGASASARAKSMEKLSSGLRINRAADDAAGLAISEKMRGQIRGLNQASRNSQDMISLVQTAEGALCETGAILQRMRELAVQAANDTNTNFDRTEIQAEVAQLIKEIDRIGNTTEFNTKKLLDGSARGLADEVAGVAGINNNSGLVIPPPLSQAFSKSVAADKNWAFDGAYMLVKTNQTADKNGNEIFNISDYAFISPNGTTFKFHDAGNNAVLSFAQLDDMIVAGQSVKITLDMYSAVAEKNVSIISQEVTFNAGTLADNGYPDGVVLMEDSDLGEITAIGAGSLLSAGSTIIGGGGGPWV